MMRLLSRQLTCRCQQAQLLCYGDAVTPSLSNSFMLWSQFEFEHGRQRGIGLIYPARYVILRGVTVSFTRLLDEGEQVAYQFCPHCGVSLTCRSSLFPHLLMIPSGLLTQPLQKQSPVTQLQVKPI
ncbi:hypothetical protein HGP28_04250 [Vibrio sp. SM6]|uniref:CENP-V/GFA domain-containing protein n=1 Tax=Vibrio agarilyticus TaxID=2726741 RepID=A0A7X8TP37_9VIBR|nr:GFA family protein [Vibrio agarilyticus]NLS12104.1 hypothetical protein [Vibrio agarilyticus]